MLMLSSYQEMQVEALTLRRQEANVFRRKTASAIPFDMGGEKLHERNATLALKAKDVSIYCYMNIS
jgi:hypothetical protein